MRSGAILCPPKVATQSILKLVPEMLSEEWQDILQMQYFLGNARFLVDQNCFCYGSGLFRVQNIS
jgi:hypothetical protein